MKPTTIRSVIAASSVGTMIEWYDFYIFGMLAKTISTQFFPEGNSTAALLSTLAIFAAGFIVRPFGALVPDLQERIVTKTAYRIQEMPVPVKKKRSMDTRIQMDVRIQCLRQLQPIQMVMEFLMHVTAVPHRLKQ